MPKEAINRIIEERNKKAVFYNQKKLFYEGINKQVNEIMREKDAMVRFYEENKDNEGMDIVGEFVRSISTIDKSDYVEKYKRLEKSIDELTQRYDKKEINISVVGKRRQGKSLLLQTISGLDGEVIPAADAGDCTGAVSVIHNDETCEKPQVMLYFYTRDEIIDTVNQYIRNISGGLVSGIFTLSEIKDLDKDERLSDLAEIVAERQDPRLSSLYEKLSKYVEHYDEWIELVEHNDGTIDKFTHRDMKDSEKIIEFVAQHNGKEGDEKEEYYKYLAVKSVDIKCRFEHGDEVGDIVLRDTIGVGDMRAINLETSMIQAVTEECDAAIIVKRPIEDTGDFDEEDAKVYNILKDSCDKRGYDMNKWFFYAINNVDKRGDGGNKKDCERTVEQIKNRKGSVACADAYIVDISKREEVTNKLLKPMLFTLIENLPLLDKDIEDRIKTEEAEMQKAFEKFRRQCKMASEINIKTTAQNMERKKADEKWEALRKSLIAVQKEYKEQRNSICGEFKDSVEALNPDFETGLKIIPSVEQIENEISSTVRAEDYIARAMDKLRIDLTKKFININDVLSDLVNKMKKRICDVLIDVGEFDKVVQTTPEKYKDELMKNPKYTKGSEYGDWLGLLARTLREGFPKNLDDYGNIITALEFLGDFNISVRSFIMQKVRDNLAKLDPDINKMPVHHMLTMKDESDEEIASNIYDILVSCYANAFYDISLEVSSMYDDPNGLLYAAVSEFCDRMLKSMIVVSTGEIRKIDNSWLELFRDELLFHPELLKAKNLCNSLKDKFEELIAK